MFKYFAMEAKGFKRRLEEALISSEKVKIIFQYPASDRAIIKSGVVLEVDEDSFTLNEVRDGESTYSYDYVIEVTSLNKRGEE